MKTVTHQLAAMRTALALLLLISLARHSLAITCLTCAPSTEDECNRESSTPCSPGSDACATIKGSRGVVKICADRAYCNKSNAGSSGSKVECCYSDDCNRAKSSGVSGRPLVSSTILFITALQLGVTFTQL